MNLATVPVGTKQCVPRLPDPWLVRTRLTRACGQVAPGEAMLVAAFAGAGKTTLLADWFTNDCLVADRAWLTVDARDNAPGRLSSLLARALGAGEALADLDGRLCSDLLVLDRVFEHVAERTEPTVLVLDDVHELTSRPALATLSHLLVAMPPSLSVFLATRADPPLPFARMQVEGRLHQLRAADLALTGDEMTDLFERYDLHLPEADVASLHARTEGWAAGARLAALALVARRDHDDVVDNIVRTDAVMSDYLVHEVLDGQSPEMRRFLLRTSLAEPLTEDLARELTGDDVRPLLEQLERSGVVVTHGGDDAVTYRFHALFGELLRARFRHDEPDLARSLQTRAAHWYVGHGLPVEGEQHAYEADNLELAATLSCRRLVREALAGGWLQPAEVTVAADAATGIPELALVAAANATALLDQRCALMWRNRLDALQPADDAKDEWLLAARLLLDVWYGRAFGTDARALESCAALLSIDLGPDTATLHALARLRQAELLLDCDDEGEEGTLRALLDGRWRASRIAARWIVDECDVLLGLVASVRGRLDSCETLLENIPPRRDDDPVADTRALARSLADAQHGRLNAARWALDSRPGSSLSSRAVRVGIDVAIADLEARDGGPTPAPIDHPFGVRVGIALGAIDGAVTGAEHAVAEARGLLARQRNEQALARVEPLVARSAAFEHLRTRVEAAILAAVAADRLDDHDRALSLLRQALDIAAPVDLRAPFQANVGLLGGMIDRYSWQLAGTSAYAAELLDDLHPEEFPVFVEPLTSRERAVLEYLPTMMTNTEIARQLLVSVNTVKTHLKAVYRKLGVTRRREAVLRAKQLEIL